MTFAWQHFKAIEYGYKIETLRVQRDGMLEVNRALRLEEASLRDPERIDTLARKLGLQSPQAGQVLHMDTAVPDGATPVMASVTSVPAVEQDKVSVGLRPAQSAGGTRQTAGECRRHKSLLGGSLHSGPPCLSKGLDGGEHTPQQREQTTLPSGGNPPALGRRNLPAPGLPANFPLRRF